MYKSQNKFKTRPIPNLKETCKLYSKSLKPYNDKKDQIEKSEKKLQEFSKKHGLILQKRLLDRVKLLQSYLYDYIQENVYLSSKKPLPYYSNYFLLTDLQFTDQIDAVAKIILSSVFLKRLIKDEKINQITTKCPSQYYMLFHSSITSIRGKDHILVHDYNENRYVIIIYKNTFWMLEAHLDYDKICDQILYITSMDLSEKRDGYLGILTCADRDSATIFKEKFVSMSNKNMEYIFYIERCMLVFCLEDKISKNMKIQDIEELCWYGDGQSRYFTRVSQVIVFKDGITAFNFNKIAIDLSVALEYITFLKNIYQQVEVSISKYRKDINYFENYSYKPLKLNYDIDPNIQKVIKSTYDAFNTFTKTINIMNSVFKEYGKTVLERKGLNVSAYITLALQAAYYRVYKNIVATRQYVCGRNFSFGFAEYMRTTTKESGNFAVSLNEPRIPRDLKIKLGQDAFKAYKNSLNDVINGKSIDTHFLGIKSVIKKSDKSPPIFEDEMFVESSHWIIETYPIINDNIKAAAFAPIYDDGICISYIVSKEEINFIGVSKQDISQFFKVLNEVMKDMKELFIQKDRDFVRAKF
jgi:carnitine O-acetyltransferase